MAGDDGDSGLPVLDAFAATANGFNNIEGAAWSPNGQVFNGSMFPYVGTSLRENWIPKALARDAVGAAIAHRNVCPALLPLVGEPGDLLEMLLANAAPGECAALQVLFEQGVRSWVRRLA